MLRIWMEDGRFTGAGFLAAAFAEAFSNGDYARATIGRRTTVLASALNQAAPPFFSGYYYDAPAIPGARSNTTIRGRKPKSPWQPCSGSEASGTTELERRGRRRSAPSPRHNAAISAIDGQSGW
jgi:hypothetical protein